MEHNIIVPGPTSFSRPPARVGERPFASESPSYQNIVNGVSWLINNARAGDNLVFYFAGYGTQFAKSQNNPTAGHEGFLLPADFASNLPKGFEADPEWTMSPEKTHDFTDLTYGYSLLSVSELTERFTVGVPHGCRVTCIFDAACAYLPNVAKAGSPTSGNHFPTCFTRFPDPKLPIHTDPNKDAVRLRYLPLPPFPIQRCGIPVTSPNVLVRSPPESLPENVLTASIAASRVQGFSASHPTEAAAEVSIEGIHYGIFTHSFVRAMAEARWEGSSLSVFKKAGEYATKLLEHHGLAEQHALFQIGGQAREDELFMG